MLLTLSLSILASLPHFLPPSNWECTKPKALSSYVQVGFVAKGSSEFRPSINFATEEVDVSLKEYVKAVKKIHSQDPLNSWRDLGKFQVQAGEARLIEITSPSPWGELKMIQVLFVKGNTAYILTGAALKEEFVQVQSDFLATFRSFSLIPDLFSPLSETKRARLEKLFADQQENQEERWTHLQKVTAECPEMGNLWRFFVLKEGYEKIFQKKI